ncbi:MAG: hypothetical protein O9246_01140 [Brevundimonas sp.]|nr:hypothetical protein [Brevundimonas sp.]
MKPTGSPPTDTLAKRDTAGRFLSGVGNGGSRGGRPKGARTKFTEQFFEDIRDAWARDGASVISRAFLQDPVASLKAVAGLMPREAKLDVTRPTDGLSDEQLDRMIGFVEARLAEMQGTVIEGRAKEVRNEQPLLTEIEPLTRAQEKAAAVRLALADQTRRIEGEEL